MIQRFSVFSGTYDNAIDPRKDPEGDFCYYFDVEPLIAERDTLLGINADLRSELSRLREGMPSPMLLDDMVYFLERSNFGLLPPDGGDGAEKDALESLNWLRRLAAGGDA